MTDVPSQIQTRAPKIATVGAMAMTGLGSSAMGDQIGDAIAKIIAWFLAVHCQCSPPPEIISACHTLCVAIVVGIAFYVHSRFLKPAGE